MDAGDIKEKSASGVGAAESWVGAVAVCRASDLAASGAGDGSVQLWALEDTNRALKPLHKLPVVMLPLFHFVEVECYCSIVSLTIASEGFLLNVNKLSPYQGSSIQKCPPKLVNLKVRSDSVVSSADCILFDKYLQKGFVNSLAFAHSGRFLLAGTGQVC